MSVDPKAVSARSTFIAACATTAAVAAIPGRTLAQTTAASFDLVAFQARARLPYPHRQAFASGHVSDGAVLGFMANSLNAYESGFADRPGTLHAAAVLYGRSVIMALGDRAWSSYKLADLVRAAGDHVGDDAASGNPYVRGPKGWSFAELQQRGASFFVCRNALNDVARKTGTTLADLEAQLLPGMMVVPAGVAAINALQEEHFTLFVAS